MKKIVLALTFCGFAASASAAPETFIIDQGHTAPRFEYTHLGYSKQVHRFDKTSGKIVYDRAAKSGSVDITIDAKSYSTAPHKLGRSTLPSTPNR